jgi:hypothetical protein
MQSCLLLTAADVRSDLAQLDLAIEFITTELSDRPLDRETRVERLAERGRLATQRRALLARLTDGSLCN